MDRCNGGLAIEIEVANISVWGNMLSSQRKREIVQWLNHEENYPLGMVRELLNLLCGTFYDQPALADEEDLEKAITDCHTKGVTN